MDGQLHKFLDFCSGMIEVAVLLEYNTMSLVNSFWTDYPLIQHHIQQEHKPQTQTKPTCVDVKTDHVQNAQNMMYINTGNASRRTVSKYPLTLKRIQILLFTTSPFEVSVPSDGSFSHCVITQNYGDP